MIFTSSQPSKCQVRGVRTSPSSPYRKTRVPGAGSSATLGVSDLIRGPSRRELLLTTKKRVVVDSIQSLTFSGPVIDGGEFVGRRRRFRSLLVHNTLFPPRPLDLWTRVKYDRRVKDDPSREVRRLQVTRGDLCPSTRSSPVRTSRVGRDSPLYVSGDLPFNSQTRGDRGVVHGTGSDPS